MPFRGHLFFHFSADAEQEPVPAAAYAGIHPKFSVFIYHFLPQAV